MPVKKAVLKKPSRDSNRPGCSSSKFEDYKELQAFLQSGPGQLQHVSLADALPQQLRALMVFCLPLIERHAPQHRDLDLLEIYAGCASITRAGEKIGLKTMAIDKLYSHDGEQDLATPRGFEFSLQHLLQGGRSSLASTRMQDMDLGGQEPDREDCSFAGWQHCKGQSFERKLHVHLFVNPISDWMDARPCLVHGTTIKHNTAVLFTHARSDSDVHAVQSIHVSWRIWSKLSQAVNCLVEQEGHQMPAKGPAKGIGETVHKKRDSGDREEGSFAGLTGLPETVRSCCGLHVQGHCFHEKAGRCPGHHAGAPT